MKINTFQTMYTANISKKKKKSHNISFVNEISLKGPVQRLTSNLQMRPSGAVWRSNTHALLHVDGASVLIRLCVPCWCWGCTVNARDSPRIALLSSTLHSELWWRLSVARWGVALFWGETNAPPHLHKCLLNWGSSKGQSVERTQSETDLIDWMSLFGSPIVMWPGGWLIVSFYHVRDDYVQCPCKSLAPFPSSSSPFLSSCWWQWCRCPAWWSFADSRGGSACLPASPGCERRPPAFPPAGQEPRGRRGEGSDMPASRPLPARAARAASRTRLRPTNKDCYHFRSFRVSFFSLLNVITSEKPTQTQPGKQKYDLNIWDASKSVSLEADFLLLIGWGCINKNGIHSRTCFGSRCCSPSQGAIQELMRASGTGPCHQPGCRLM